MANSQKCATGTEANADALLAIVVKALAYPQIGTHVGGGIHVTMPPTWDGTGPCPPGWTKQPVAVWVQTVNAAAVPVSDALAALLQGAPAQARLSGTEKTTLSAAIAARAIVDLEAGVYVPK